MKQQLTAITAIRLYRERPPAFLRALTREQDGFGEKFKELALLAFTCVSETLITSSLANVPADERVMRAIRDMILEHARDEAKHHLYFSCFMEIMWHQLTVAEMPEAAWRWRSRRRKRRWEPGELAVEI
jgi:hypothetical protein